jgi:protein-S-isoprenylcysteine O-methyltransferase Ste14
VTQRRNFWMRWRVRTGYPVAVIFLILAAPTPRSILIGGAVALVGILIRGASSGYLRKYEELATTGPYAHTRNPLYFGSAFLAAGFAIAGNSWLAGALVIAYFAIFYSAVMRNEENDLRERFGAVFNDYAASVPLFFPRIVTLRTKSSQISPPQKAFFWPQYRRNREYNALVGTVAGLGVMCLRMWIRRRFGH